MADQTATFRVVVIDEASGSIDNAANSLARLDKAIDDGQKNLRALQKTLGDLKKATTPNAAAIEQVSATIRAQKDALADMNAQYLKIGGGARIAGKSTNEFAEDLKDLQEELGGLPGPVNSALGGMRKLVDMFTKNSGAVIRAGIVGGALAVVGAAGAATKALYEMGTAAADARRTEGLQFEAPDRGAMLGAIDAVAARVPLARGEVVSMAQELYKAGKRGDELKAALEQVAFTKAAEGGDIAAQMSSLTVQAEKAKEAFDALFGGLDIDGWLNAWREVGDLMSQSTAEGRALRTLMTTVIQPIIDASKEAAPYLKRFFQGVILAALNFAIVVLTIRNAWRRAFGSDSQKDGDDLMWVAKLGEAALWAFVGVLAVSAVVVPIFAAKLAMMLIPTLWAMVPAAWAAIAPFLPFVLALLAVGAAIAVLILYWDDLAQIFGEIDWGQLGIDMIDGILKPLQAGYAIITEAVTNLADGAISAFKKAIGAASPAKLFIAAGESIPEGVAVGVEEGAPAAREATENMLGDIPQLGAAGGALPGSADGSAAGAQRGGGNTISIGEVIIHAAAGDAAQLAQDFRRELERVLEGLALELGAPHPGRA